jgi:hypothetical protein
MNQTQQARKTTPIVLKVVLGIAALFYERNHSIQSIERLGSIGPKHIY